MSVTTYQVIEEPINTKSNWPPSGGRILEITNTQEDGKVKIERIRVFKLSEMFKGRVMKKV